MIEPKQTRGRVYWVTGLSQAGKTTVGTLLCRELWRRKNSAVLLDGDDLRGVFGDDLGYDAEARLQSAMRYARLCRMLSDQGIDVVCATISMAHDCRRWNRQHIARYFEIYLRVPMDELVARDCKGLYRRAQAGEIQNVVGVDILVEEPEAPDLVIDNYGATTPENVLAMILAATGSAVAPFLGPTLAAAPAGRSDTLLDERGPGDE